MQRIKITNSKEPKSCVNYLTRPENGGSKIHVDKIRLLNTKKVTTLQRKLYPCVSVFLTVEIKWLKFVFAFIPFALHHTDTRLSAKLYPAVLVRLSLYLISLDLEQHAVDTATVCCSHFNLPHAQLSWHCLISIHAYVFEPIARFIWIYNCSGQFKNKNEVENWTLSVRYLDRFRIKTTLLLSVVANQDHSTRRSPVL